MTIANRKLNGITDRLDEFLEKRSAGTATFMAQMTGIPMLQLTRLLDAASDSNQDEQERLRARLNLNLVIGGAYPKLRKRMGRILRKPDPRLVA